MLIWIEHLKAWWRGDLAAITKVFDEAVRDLKNHEQYLVTIADNQAQAARNLAARSKWLYDEAAKVKAIGAKIAALIEG